MQPPNPTIEQTAGKPISLGLTCWRWQRRAARIVQLAQGMGVKLQLTEHVSGLRREIECQISGKNADRFIGEFFRRC